MVTQCVAKARATTGEAERKVAIEEAKDLLDDVKAEISSQINLDALVHSYYQQAAARLYVFHCFSFIFRLLLINLIFVFLICF